MVYSTNKIATIAECDALIQELNADLVPLNRDLASVQVAINSNTTIASVIPAQLAQVESDLALRQAELALATTLADRGPLEVQINNLENSRIRLNLRMQNLAGLGLLDKEHKQAKIEGEIAIINEFKTAIEARKTELQNSANAA